MQAELPHHETGWRKIGSSSMAKEARDDMNRVQPGTRVDNDQGCCDDEQGQCGSDQDH